jgi:hypothetical protein
LFYKNTLNADGSRDRSTTNDYSEAQRVIAGSSTPDWIAGFTNNIDYKNFDFSFTSKENLGQVSTMQVVSINLQMQTGLITKQLTK